MKLNKPIFSACAGIIFVSVAGTIFGLVDHLTHFHLDHDRINEEADRLNQEKRNKESSDRKWERECSLDSWKGEGTAFDPPNDGRGTSPDGPDRD